MTGIALGSVYTLVGLSFTLIVATTGLFNFALVAVVSIGGITAYEALNVWQIPVLTAVGLSICVGLVCGLVLDVLVRRPFRRSTKDIGIPVLLSSIGISIAVEAVLAQRFGASPRQVVGYTSTNPLFLRSVPIEPAYIVMTATSIGIVVIFELILHLTSTGRRLSAVQQDRVGAQLLGINVSRLTMVIFAISGSLAALAGFLVTPVSLASSNSGDQLICRSLLLPLSAASAAFAAQSSARIDRTHHRIGTIVLVSLDREHHLVRGDHRGSRYSTKRPVRKFSVEGCLRCFTVVPELRPGWGPRPECSRSWPVSRSWCLKVLSTDMT